MMVLKVMGRAATTLLLACGYAAGASSQAASSAVSAAQGLIGASVSTDKARYAPGQPVQLVIAIDNSTGPRIDPASVIAEIQDLGHSVSIVRRAVSIEARKSQQLQLTLMPPATNFHGYRVEVRLLDSREQLLTSAATAIDVSSDWTHFPRYGYLAHYDANVPANEWIAELNRFHIDGLQFYDFQYKHHLPLPPSEMAKSSWPDIANRPTSSKTLQTFLSAAKEHNMTTMAYNASYAAYDDAFHDGSGVKLQWATWPDAAGPRTEETTKALPMPAGWATKRLVYMNQYDPGWQTYIFSRMRELFAVVPFDGWHIDTFGDPGAFAWDGSPIDYFAGFAKFADAARAKLRRPVLLNTVGSHGQVAMANSAVDFVYSELWPEDHATYESILAAADEIHAANPTKGLVFAAYLHRNLSDRLQKDGGHAQFNAPAVLLADAVMFSVGAAHLELGDGDRMLSNPYFVADTAIRPSQDLRAQLKNYYDFLVAYENYLRDGALPASFPIGLSGLPQTTNGQPRAVWTIGRRKDRDSIVHLINFTCLKQTEWGDDELNYPPESVLHNVRITVQVPNQVTDVGWASPDIDEGRWHALSIRKTPATAASYEVTIPELRYWTVVIFRRPAQNN